MGRRGRLLQDICLFVNTGLDSANLFQLLISVSEHLWFMWLYKNIMNFVILNLTYYLLFPSIPRPQNDL